MTVISLTSNKASSGVSFSPMDSVMGHNKRDDADVVDQHVSFAPVDVSVEPNSYKDDRHLRSKKAVAFAAQDEVYEFDASEEDIPEYDAGSDDDGSSDTSSESSESSTDDPPPYVEDEKHDDLSVSVAPGGGSTNEHTSSASNTAASPSKARE